MALNNFNNSCFKILEAALDRITVFTKVSRSKENLLKEQILKNGGKFKYNRDAAGKFYLNTARFNINYVPLYGTIWLSFNPLTFKGRFNIGSLTTFQTFSVAKEIDECMKKLLQVELFSISKWEVSSLEIRKDIICSSIEMKQKLLLTMSKLNNGHFKEYGTECGKYIYNRLWTIKVYDKFNEIVSTGKKGSLPAGCTVDELKRTVRIELEIRRQKLKEITSRITLGSKKFITLEYLLGEKLVNPIFCELLKDLHLNGKFTGLNNMVRIIEKNIQGRKLRNSLINFIIYIKNNSIDSAIIQFPSFYRWRNILESIGLSCICLDIKTNISFSLSDETKYEVKNKIYLLFMLVEFLVQGINRRMYNIILVFDILKKLLCISTIKLLC